MHKLGITQPFIYTLYRCLQFGESLGFRFRFEDFMLAREAGLSSDSRFLFDFFILRVAGRPCSGITASMSKA